MCLTHGFRDVSNPVGPLAPAFTKMNVGWQYPVEIVTRFGIGFDEGVQPMSRHVIVHGRECFRADAAIGWNADNSLQNFRSLTRTGVHRRVKDRQI